MVVRKSRGLRNLICIGLILTMGFELCACRDAMDTDANVTLKNVEEDVTADTNAILENVVEEDATTGVNEALEKEYVYTYEEIELPAIDVGDDMVINSVTRYDGRIYIVVDIYHGHEVDGSNRKVKQIPNRTDVLNCASQVLVRDDGSLVVIYSEKPYVYNMVKYDANTDTLGEVTQIPDSALGGYCYKTAGITTDIVYSNPDGIFSYSEGDEQPTQIMSYMNSNLNVDYMSKICMLDETRFLGFYYDKTDQEYKGAIFDKQK